ncbi:MAG: type II toxin-antitoxin system RelE/ParE family toxin [Rhodocyclaceae bacterium]|nr:type II toxin-antitoxin system RelE/ParE family toxin [Rhodocyclaceae bacterium]
MGYTSHWHIKQTDGFRDWLDALTDVSGRARILMRIDRLAHGNPGDHRNLTKGVADLRIDSGPGYRVYFARQGSALILLLAGGDKSTQARDIARALQLAHAHGGTE